MLCCASREQQEPSANFSVLKKIAWSVSMLCALPVRNADSVLAACLCR